MQGDNLPFMSSDTRFRDAICPDVGQSAHAAAMGEAIADYFAEPAAARNDLVRPCPESR
jgi:hypothetical protein